MIVKILYGSGLRITEAVRLGVQDVDFDYKQITVRSGKGDKDRVTTFSATLITLFKKHLDKVKLIHEKDLAGGFGAVYLPYALEKNTRPPLRDGAGNRYFLCACCRLIHSAVLPGGCISISR